MSYHYDYATKQPVRSGDEDESTAMVGSACWPTTTTGNETLDKIKVWLDKPTLASHPVVKNKHVVVGVVAVVGLGLLAHHNHWI